MSAGSLYIPVMTWRLFAAAVIVASPASAGDDHDLAMKARQRSEVIPLAQLLPKIEAAYGGRLLGIELHNSDQRYIYDLELITPDGRMIEIPVDAATGAVLPEGADRGDPDDDKAQ
jgi:uncharacterized membrane protein YkoI